MTELFVLNQVTYVPGEGAARTLIRGVYTTLELAQKQTPPSNLYLPIEGFGWWGYASQENLADGRADWWIFPLIVDAPCRVEGQSDDAKTAT